MAGRNDRADDTIHLVSPGRVDKHALASRSLDQRSVARSPQPSVEREDGILQRLIEVGEAQLVVEMRPECRTVKTVRVKLHQLKIMFPVVVANCKVRLPTGQVDSPFQVPAQLSLGVDTSCPARRIPGVDLIVAV